jgi:hypothetical protein
VVDRRPGPIYAGPAEQHQEAVVALEDIYHTALTEFEKLTDRQAATTKNKGNEAGIKKLKLLFKQGKTIEQRLADFDLAMEAARKSDSPASAKKALQQVDVTRKKLSEGLKKNIKEFETLAPFVATTSQSKTAYEIFVKRLTQIHVGAKAMAEDYRPILLDTIGGSRKPTADAKVMSAVKKLSLDLRKGIAETEALIKMFLEKPNRKTFEAAFMQGVGPRSLTTTIKGWRQLILSKDPTLARRITVDPAALERDLSEYAGIQNPGDWARKFRVTDLSGTDWYDAATRMANDCLAELRDWRKLVDELRALM